MEPASPSSAPRRDALQVRVAEGKPRIKSAAGQAYLAGDDAAKMLVRRLSQSTCDIRGKFVEGLDEVELCRAIVCRKAGGWSVKKYIYWKRTKLKVV